MTAEDVPGHRMPRVEPHELTDYSLLPRRLDHLVGVVDNGFADMRTYLEVLSSKILPTLDYLRETVTAVLRRIERIEDRQNVTERRLDALEALALAAPEARPERPKLRALKTPKRISRAKARRA